MDHALREFAEKGYGLSSINTICETGGISKGVLYHYFKDKDEVYLTCIGECFDSLTAYLNGHAVPAGSDVQSCLSAYFDYRLVFFRENPLYQRLFFEAVISPPPHLSAAIGECKAAFDDLNHRVFNTMLGHVKLRKGLKKEEVIEIFRQYQDFINATTPAEDMVLHEKRCRRAVGVLLYGVIAREEEGQI